MTMSVPAAALAAMGQEDFERLVRGSVRGDTDPAIWEALTAPEVILRTKACLSATSSDVQNQIAMSNADLQQKQVEGFRLGPEGKQAYFEAVGEKAAWRKRALSYRRQVDRRLAFVKSRMPSNKPTGPTGSASMRKHNQEALEKLARAVAAHRDRVLSGEGSEDDDEKLWGCLEDVTAVSVRGGEMPLGEWVDWLDGIRDEDAERRGQAS